MLSRLLLLAAASPCAALALVPAVGRVAPRPVALRPAVTMSEAGVAAGESELYAQSSGGRVAVSGLQPSAQGEQQFAGVQQAPEPAPAPSFVQKAKGPFMGLTLVATAAIASWQSNRVYQVRQAALLDEFAGTMVFHLGDEKEMQACLASFRTQLGPGQYRSRMFGAFLKQMAQDVSIGVGAVQNLQKASALFGLKDADAAAILESAAADLSKQPSVLGKLTFLAERGLPAAATQAKLRTKFPNWSFDTVTALQRAMLENLYRELIVDLAPGSQPDPTTLQVLGLSEDDAARLMADVQAAKAREEAERQAELEEERKAARMQAALERAAQLNDDPKKKMTTRSTSPPPPAAPDAPAAPDTPSAPSAPAADDSDGGADETGAAGTHEYECTGCGYIIFPAAGREFKFFGNDFTCPQCGAGKDAFVDNGPAE